MNNEYHNEASLVKEALTYRKSDQEIGMPDVEAELRRFHAEHDRQQFAKPQSSHATWRRVAAIVAVIALLSGITIAGVHYYKYELTQIEAEETRANTETRPKVTQEQQPVVAKPVITDTEITYSRAELRQIVADLTSRFELDAPVYDHPQAQRILMHVSLPKEGSLEESLEVLNHFGRVQFEIVDHHIHVK